MKFRQNKSFRNLGIYKLQDELLILLKRSEQLSFLFTPDTWNLHGPVDYRVSHGGIYRHGELTTWTDEDLQDTGMTADPPNPYMLLDYLSPN